MAIGDVASQERGSGARFNDGKPAFELVPLFVLADSLFGGRKVEGDDEANLMGAMYALSAWQEGGGVRDLYGAAQLVALAQHVTIEQAWEDCARVFDYGRRKYAAWNWAKGMPWSAPLGCAVRHLLAMVRGEELDPESGLPHRGHFMCNITMLAQYRHTFPEGDDRPTEWLKSPKPEIIPHEVAKLMQRDGLVPSCGLHEAAAQGIPHHATDAPMPPHLAGYLDGREDDTGEAYDVSRDPDFRAGGTA